MAILCFIFADMEGSVRNFNAPTSDKKEAESTSNLSFHLMPNCAYQYQMAMSEQKF